MAEAAKRIEPGAFYNRKLGCLITYDFKSIRQRWHLSFLAEFVFIAQSCLTFLGETGLGSSDGRVLSCLAQRCGFRSPVEGVSNVEEVNITHTCHVRTVSPMC